MIAILADHCNVCCGWIRGLVRHHELGHEAVGGAVENGATERLTDWAVYFCEYAQFMLPIPQGPVDNITGNNSAYSLRLLQRLKDEDDLAVWEGFLHHRMKLLDVRPAPSRCAQEGIQAWLYPVAAISPVTIVCGHATARGPYLEAVSICVCDSDTATFAASANHEDRVEKGQTRLDIRAMHPTDLPFSHPLGVG